MQIHHQTYVTNYNNALEQLDQAVNKGDASASSSTAEVMNHSIFWKNLAPVNVVETPKGALDGAIDTHFGSLEGLVKKMSAEGAALQGSGWVTKELKKLVVDTTANQDPLVTKGSLVPLVGIDYKNVRPDYLKNVWKVINWNYAGEFMKRNASEFVTDNNIKRTQSPTRLCFYKVF
ncbi:hypothetical protein Bca52824_025656 [Brassica carinata]|uniref:Superoxide dismutase n=1 Tax=Brassica carinata TaxID=52824 RepID=A0A8X7SGM3_BRACI|nr:hypothetical protein Bca52824_025656 [Brassica carinata]